MNIDVPNVANIPNVESDLNHVPHVANVPTDEYLLDLMRSARYSTSTTFF